MHYCYSIFNAVYVFKVINNFKTLIILIKGEKVLIIVKNGFWRRHENFKISSIAEQVKGIFLSKFIVF